jgi:hypothetical protein
LTSFVLDSLGRNGEESHTFAVWSKLAVKIRAPSELKDADEIGAMLPLIVSRSEWHRRRT